MGLFRDVIGGWFGQKGEEITNIGRQEEHWPRVIRRYGIKLHGDVHKFLKNKNKIKEALTQHLVKQLRKKEIDISVIADSIIKDEDEIIDKIERVDIIFLKALEEVMRENQGALSQNLDPRIVKELNTEIKKRIYKFGKNCVAKGSILISIGNEAQKYT